MQRVSSAVSLALINKANNKRMNAPAYLGKILSVCTEALADPLYPSNTETRIAVLSASRCRYSNLCAQ